MLNCIIKNKLKSCFSPPAPAVATPAVHAAPAPAPAPARPVARPRIATLGNMRTDDEGPDGEDEESDEEDEDQQVTCCAGQALVCLCPVLLKQNSFTSVLSDCSRFIYGKILESMGYI